MTDFGEGTHGDEAERPANDQRRRIKIRLTFYFDGTGNNRVNVQSREMVDRGPQARPGQGPDPNFARARAAVANSGGDDTSYANDQTNVVRLYENAGGVDAARPEYEYYVPVYVEGIGTVNLGDDTTRGYAFGTGPTGVVGKVNRGIALAVNLLNKLPFPRRTTFVERLTVDTCGFSRGAAAARYCIHRVLFDSANEPETGPSVCLKAKLQALGWQVGTVEVQAVGLFDTVSSYGASYGTDVAELRLNAIRSAKAVYQLAAAEEYRERFSLTDITSAGDKGQQVYLPGAHSDVGGSYRDGAGEHKTLMSGAACGDVAQFLRARGWYRGAQELVHTQVPHGGSYLAANRAGIRNAYTFIPLRLMAYFLRKQEVPIKPVLYSRHNPQGVPGRAAIERYAMTVGRRSRPGDWERVDPTLGALRHGYLHISFSVNSVSDWLGKSVRVENVGTFWRPQYRPHRDLAHG